MNRTDRVAYFSALTREQILADVPAKWGDYELLDVLADFDKDGDRDRAEAVAELILHSPEYDIDLIAYDQLYEELVNYYVWKDDYVAAKRWAYGMIAHEARRNLTSESHLNWMNMVRLLGKCIYMLANLMLGWLFSRAACEWSQETYERTTRWGWHCQWLI